MLHGHLDYFQKPPLVGRLSTKLGDHDTWKAYNRWFILFYHVWGSACIEIHWNSIWLRARSHMTSHYTWQSVTTLHDFGCVFGRPLDTFFWALHNFMVTGSWLVCEVALIRATSHMSQDPWPCNGEHPWLSSKGRTMCVGKAVICRLGPSSIVWNENGPCCGTIAYFIGGKEGIIWFNIICLKLSQFKRIIW
jgi:hypothetical protein